jgi:hypothetical protein
VQPEKRGYPEPARKGPPVRSRLRMTIPAPSRPDDPPRARLPTALVTWAFVGLILVLVVALVVDKLTEGTSASPALHSTPAPASVLSALSGLPAGAFDRAGTSALTGPEPQVLSGQPPLLVDGRPAMVFVGAEFSPYSAAVSWALVAALDRFGSFTHLGSTASSVAEIFASTPGFTFSGSVYRSAHVSLVTLERYGPSLSTVAPAGFSVTGQPSPTVEALLRRYDSGAPAGETLPFLDVDNRLLAVGAGFGYSPGLLHGMSMAQVAAALTDPTSPAGAAVLAAADELSAAICSAEGQSPATVCASPGVQAAASSLGLG